LIFNSHFNDFTQQNISRTLYSSVKKAVVSCKQQAK